MIIFLNKNNFLRYFRCVAYREYIQLVYGYMGKKRISLPACAYGAIRQRFGGKAFKGFEGHEDVEDGEFALSIILLQ